MHSNGPGRPDANELLKDVPPAAIAAFVCEQYLQADRPPPTAPGIPAELPGSLSCAKKQCMVRLTTQLVAGLARFPESAELWALWLAIHRSADEVR